MARVFRGRACVGAYGGMKRDRPLVRPGGYGKEYRHRDRTVVEAVVATKLNMGNVGKTARQLGVPSPTVRRWVAGETRMSDRVKDMIERTSEEMAQRLEDVAWGILERMPEKIDDASLHQSASAVAVCIDKMRLLRNQATSIVDDIAELTDAERAERLARLYDAAAAERSQRAADGAQAPSAQD